MREFQNSAEPSSQYWFRNPKTDRQTLPGTDFIRFGSALGGQQSLSYELTDAR